MDRSGKAMNVTPEVKPYGYPSASSDGKKIALTLEGSSYDIWVYDVERDTFTKASFGGDDYRPHLAPDGKMLGYDSSKSGHQQIYVKNGIAQGDETAVTDGPEDKEFCGFTPDGRDVIFARQNKDTGWDLYAAAVDGDHRPRPLVVGPFNQRGARISPDGKWLAYVSDESGQHEIFVQAMNDASLRAQVSSEGGDGPRWAPSSNELLFLAKNRVMSAKFSSVGGLNPSKPALLFEERGWTDFDVAADGRLLVTRDADSNGNGRQINVVLHWFDELKREQGK
jgi:Tol biopolymer transport system component